MTSSQPLLRKFLLHEGRGIDSLSATIAPYIGANTVALECERKEVRALMNLRQLQKTALFYGRFDNAFSVEVSEATSFLHGFPIRGNAQHVNNGSTISESSTRGAVGGPGALKLSYGPNFELFALFIRPQSLSAALSALVGVPVSGQLRLDKDNHERGPETRALRGIVRTMIEEADCEGSEPSPVLLAELEQAALVAFLCGTAHNHSHLLAAPARSGAPWQVRRIEDYIEANWDQPITVEALAALTNSSARSVFHSFKEYRGYSPMHFVKQVRLRRARAMLVKQSAELSVTEVAMVCGFGNLGHFANDYFSVFGERPSKTRNASKGRAGRADADEMAGARIATSARRKIALS
jgi:AraC-like DNA-binding protein